MNVKTAWICGVCICVVCGCTCAVLCMCKYCVACVMCVYLPVTLTGNGKIPNMKFSFIFTCFVDIVCRHVF